VEILPKSLVELSVEFDNKVLEILFYNSMVCLQDGKIHKLDDALSTKIPKYCDSTEKESFLYTCSKLMSSSTIVVADRIFVQSSDVCTNLIHDLIDLNLALRSTEFYFKKCTDKQMVQWENNAVLSSSGNAKIGFFGSLTAPWKIQCVLPKGRRV
jgi:hypothetical protein